MLKIENIELVKITKINEEKIVFIYEDEKYWIVKEGENDLILFHYTPEDENGQFSLEELNRAKGNFPTVIYNTRRTTNRYSDIKLDCFIWDLSTTKIIESCFSRETKRLTTSMKNQQSKLEEEEKLLKELQKSIKRRKSLIKRSQTKIETFGRTWEDLFHRR